MDSECEDKIYKYKILTSILTVIIFVLVLFIIINDSYGYYNVEKQDNDNSSVLIDLSQGQYIYHEMITIWVKNTDVTIQVHDFVNYIQLDINFVDRGKSASAILSDSNFCPNSNHCSWGTNVDGDQSFEIFIDRGWGDSMSLDQYFGSHIEFNINKD